MSSQREKERFRKNLERIEPILKKEDAVLFPKFKKTLIVADLHGDLQTLKFILKFAEKKKVDAMIFLGDYIDKGSESVAVLNLLFELKLKDPKSVILLRGNHETRGLSAWFEFSDDLIHHPELFDTANTVFDRLPIAAVLNDSIFCVHGNIAGISDEKLKDISKKNPKPYIWNDPGPEDGIALSGRGSGVYRVGPDLTQKFLKQNNLQLVIRGHTSHTEGTKCWHGSRLVSLYSTFPYDSPTVRAAAAIVKEDRIKFYYYKKIGNGLEWQDETMKLRLKK
ncbi:metallophosphoesterase family protein [Methanimicrococcus hacksteinii]|nr:metallophosphoesterase family protein [Methanimicrococcus sp. At1]